MSQKLKGQIRTFLAAAAGLAVAFGWMDPASADWVIGVLMYAFAAYWSWQSKTAPTPPDVDTNPTEPKEFENDDEHTN